MSDDYSPYIAVQAEGVRVGLLSCLRCGSVVLMEPGEDRRAEHDRWHDFLTANLELPDLSPTQPEEDE